VTEQFSRPATLDPFNELERNNIAHLDAAGIRYYLPALMLSVLTEVSVGIIARHRSI
jgi:hypothetical protein